MAAQVDNGSKCFFSFSIFFWSQDKHHTLNEPIGVFYGIGVIQIYRMTVRKQMVEVDSGDCYLQYCLKP